MSWLIWPFWNCQTKSKVCYFWGWFFMFLWAKILKNTYMYLSSVSTWTINCVCQSKSTLLRLGIYGFGLPSSSKKMASVDDYQIICGLIKICRLLTLLNWSLWSSFLCWISGVVPFNTRLISSWEENNYCYKLSKCTKWHQFH